MDHRERPRKEHGENKGLRCLFTSSFFAGHLKAGPGLLAASKCLPATSKTSLEHLKGIPRAPQRILLPVEEFRRATFFQARVQFSKLRWFATERKPFRAPANKLEAARKRRPKTRNRHGSRARQAHGPSTRQTTRSKILLHTASLCLCLPVPLSAYLFRGRPRWCIGAFSGALMVV